MWVDNRLIYYFRYQKIFEDVFTGYGFGGRVVGMKRILLSLSLIYFVGGQLYFNQNTF